MTHEEFLLNLMLLGFKYKNTVMPARAKYVHTDNSSVTLYVGAMAEQQSICISKGRRGFLNLTERTSTNYQKAFEYLQERNDTPRIYVESNNPRF
jgi:hypothetical protein